MRTFTVVLLIITIVIAGTVGFCMSGVKANVEMAEVNVISVNEMPELYQKMKNDIERDTFGGTFFRNTDYLDSEECRFMNFTITIANHGALPMDYIEIKAVPEKEDYLQMENETFPSLAAFSSGQMRVTLLTEREGDENRDFSVSYYVLGKKYTVNTKRNQN